ncbi:FtsX-like permease family protein [Kaarinaea lacus]
MNLWKVGFRHYTRHPWQIILSIFGIALGVAVVVAVDLASSSAQKAFELSSEAVSGTATHEVIGGPEGIPENIYTDLRVVEGFENIAPVVEGYGQLANIVGSRTKTVHVLGIDVFAETGFRDHLQHTTEPLDIARFLTGSNAAIMLESTARDFGLHEDSEFELLIRGVKHEFTVVGLIKDADKLQQQALNSFVIVDIATAQEVLGMQGRLSYIDLQLPEDNSNALVDKIKTLLPQQVNVVASQSRSHAMAQMTHAFHANLSALSLLALLVGVFLIYNAMTFAVIQRRNTLGYLRTLGVTKQQIFRLILSEALILGLISTALGIVLGILLGNSLLHLVSRTINDLYFVVSVSQLNITFLSLLKGILLGLFATIAAVIIPAREATNCTARASLSRSILEGKYKKGVTTSSWLGYLLLALGVSVLLIPTKSLFVSFAGLFILIMGFALLVPLLTIFLIKLITPIIRAFFGELGNISARGVTASFSRTGVAVSALTIAVATTIGVTVMIDSFRLSVVNWLDNTLRADVFITPAGYEANSSGGVSSFWLDRLNSLPQIEALSISRSVQIYINDDVSQLYVIQLPRKAFTRYKFIEGDASSARNAFYDNEAVLISEPYSFRHNLHVGDTVTLPTDRGEKTFNIAGVYVDYGSEQGAITINRKTYLQYWNDGSISSLGIYLQHDTNTDEFMAELREIVDNELSNPYKQIKEQDLEIRSNVAIREASIAIFDRTFAVTQVLRLLAIIVAFIGILSALMAIQIERSRELALMRAIGLTPRQLWIVVSGETGIMGALAGLLALPVGISLAVVLVYVINRRSFGWSMELSVDPFVLAQAIILAVVAALLAGAYPASRLSRIKPAGALREE